MSDILYIHGIHSTGCTTLPVEEGYMNKYGKCFNEPSADLDGTLVPWQSIFTYDKSPLKLLHVTQAYNFHVIEVVDLILTLQTIL